MSVFAQSTLVADRLEAKKSKKAEFRVWTRDLPICSRLLCRWANPAYETSRIRDPISRASWLLIHCNIPLMICPPLKKSTLVATLIPSRGSLKKKHGPFGCSLSPTPWSGRVFCMYSKPQPMVSSTLPYQSHLNCFSWPCNIQVFVVFFFILVFAGFIGHNDQMRQEIYLFFLREHGLCHAVPHVGSRFLQSWDIVFLFEFFFGVDLSF